MEKTCMIMTWAVLLLIVAHPVLAGNFSISPVKVFLSPGQKTESLQINNSSQFPLSIQIQVKEWRQDQFGKDVFQSTSDIVVFPRIFSVDPGEERLVRLGVKTSPGLTEKTYRVFVEELPEAGQENEVRSLKLLLKMSLPVFFAPAAAPVKQGNIARASMQNESLAVSVANTGNSYLFIKTITAKGVALNGKEVAFPAQKGWYLLSGGEVSYPLKVDKEQCGQLKELQILVDSDGLEMNKVVSVDDAFCQG